VKWDGTEGRCRVDDPIDLILPPVRRFAEPAADATRADPTTDVEGCRRKAGMAQDAAVLMRGRGASKFRNLLWGELLLR
jgi:hypothetical protein